MTKIKIFKNNDVYMGFECSGHSGYAEFGKDIVCASVSSIMQACILGIVKVLKVKAIIEREDKKGYIKIELPLDLDKNILDRTQVLFETVRVSIEDLLDGYSKYISMEVIENVY
jgi:uncharacterized protein YsxB (DUF464 family)